MVRDLKFYKGFILKKLDEESFKSALSKARSALTIIKEYEDLFVLETELEDFNQLNEDVSAVLKKHRDTYVKRLYKLLKKKLDEKNLEKFMKLLASLKDKVDRNLDDYNLEDISSNIIRYFIFIKRLYIILSSYEIVNYFEVSESIFEFINDLEFEDFPNLEKFIQSIFQRLVTRRLFELSKRFNKLNVSELSDILALPQEDLIDLIFLIMEQPENPIKVYNATTQEIIFKIE